MSTNRSGQTTAGKTQGWRDMSPTIRIATTQDLDMVLTFYHELCEAVTGTPSDCYWRRDIHPSDEFLTQLVEDGCMYLVMCGSQLGAAAGIDHDLGHEYENVTWQVDVDPQEAVVIHLLATHPDHRGLGLARTLLSRLAEDARAIGAKALRLDATGNNAPAIALYQSEGFACVGTGEQDIHPDGEAPVPFVVMERVL